MPIIQIIILYQKSVFYKEEGIISNNMLAQYGKISMHPNRRAVLWIVIEQLVCQTV